MLRLADFEPPLLYARCWEDDATLRAALAIQPGDSVLSIGSAGDNSFALLLDDPAQVTLLDRNRTQLAVVHLKMACLRRFDPHDTRRFLGTHDALPAERRRRFAQVRGDLPLWAAEHLASAPDVIDAGILHAGKFERYLAMFRNRVLPVVQSKKTIEDLLDAATLNEQRYIYDLRWNSRRWRTLFRLFFSRRVMERRGRERAFFDHVDEASISDVFISRAAKALCDMPARSNPYLCWILAKRELPPPYLDDAHYATIRDRLDRITIVEDSLGDHASSAAPQLYDAHNLSDCFEYLTQPDTNTILADLVRISRSGARLAYWNLLVPRDGVAVPGLTAHSERAEALHATDRAFFYGRLVLETAG
ncbi:MAG: S-adenosylmethionine-diacylglycerol 3-amino-3-carboxypropyl transferase [Myxococcota bacterium]|jgi:S-adenosylmethionine-diacylglycerol 3-amino-3-carboxypropyl transferase